MSVDQFKTFLNVKTTQYLKWHEIKTIEKISVIWQPKPTVVYILPDDGDIVA